MNPSGFQVTDVAARASHKLFGGWTLVIFYFIAHMLAQSLLYDRQAWEGATKTNQRIPDFKDLAVWKGDKICVPMS